MAAKCCSLSSLKPTERRLLAAGWFLRILKHQSRAEKGAICVRVCLLSISPSSGDSLLLLLLQHPIKGTFHVALSSYWMLDISGLIQFSLQCVAGLYFLFLLLLLRRSPFKIMAVLLSPYNRAYAPRSKLQDVLWVVPGSFKPPVYISG